MTDNGDIAQLGERLNGIQEVSGSIPLISTRNDEPSEKSGGFFANVGALIFSTLADRIKQKKHRPCHHGKVGAFSLAVDYIQGCVVLKGFNIIGQQSDQALA